MRRSAFAQVALRLCANFRGTLGRRREIYAGTARFRQPDGDRLLYVRSAVYAFALNEKSVSSGCTTTPALITAAVRCRAGRSRG